MDNGVEARVRDLIAPIIQEEGLSLYDVEWKREMGRAILRVYIEGSESGVSLDDCTRVSHSVEDLIEVKEAVPGAYTLEVSSPGLNRVLRTAEHFKRVVGKLIQVKTFEPIDGSRNFKGHLQSSSEQEIDVLVDGKAHRIPVASIAKARVEYVP